MGQEINWFGIDFGTTNSAVVSYTGLEGKDIHVIHYGDGASRPLPSFVAIHKTNGEVVTGRKAKENLNLSEDYEIFMSIKSIIDQECTWEIAGKEWTPVDIAAELFKGLKASVKDRTDVDMQKVVLAVPIGFSADKRNKLRKAAALAGIDITTLISEPTAAFCSHYAELKRYKNIAVFDWGGGTLDVVILKVEDGQVFEIASDGISLAGNDIDRKLAEKIHMRVARKKNSELSFDEMDAQSRGKLLAACERAKCNLSDEDIVKIQMAKYGELGPFIEKIEYDYFNLLTEQEVTAATECLRDTIKLAGLNKASLDCILCVGGTSRLRGLQERLIGEYGEDMLIFPRKAMWDIAEGAAVVATRPGCYTLNKSIGLLLSNGDYFPLLSEGQRLPCEENHLTLGVVESNEKGNIDARFVFTDDEKENKRTFVDYLSVPLRGFSDEIMRLSCYVDTDMIFKLKISSNRRPDNVFRVWKYDKIKVSYDIEGEG